MLKDLTLNSFSVRLSKPQFGSWTSTQKFNFMLVVGIVLLGLGYSFTISSLGTKGYEIKRVESRLQAIENEQKSLQIQSSDLQSINQIQNQATLGQFVPVTQVTYIKDANFALK